MAKKPVDLQQEVEKSIRDAIIEKVYEYIKSNKRVPSRANLSSMGISKDQYRNQFNTIENLLQAVISEYPDIEQYVLTAEQIFTPEMVSKVKQLVKTHSRFVITTAVTGMPVHEGFLLSIKNYCKRNNAALLVLPSTDPAASVPFELDALLKNEGIVVQEIDINKNLMLSTLRTSAKQINTLTGLRRIGQREKSMLVASPKQFIEYVPVLNSESNHALITTGSITTSEYLSTDKYMSLRTAWLADKDHELGAIIVEVVDKKYFHFRPIQATEEGNFTDLGTQYLSNDLKCNNTPEAVVLGDIHVGSIDRNVYKSTNKILRKLKPKRVFFHDLFDGVSCNPHMSMQNLVKASLKDKLSIEAEIKLVKSYLEMMKKNHPYVEEWIVVRSNHDLFLDRYLDSSDYTTDPTNFEFCHELVLRKMRNDEIPLKAGLVMVDTNLDKITFLDEDDSYKVAGFECGQHGHRGLNGQRNPANSSLEIAFGKGVFGHSHTGGKLRKIFRVGTSTRYKLGYNKGASSWTHTLCVIYGDGTAQLINDINGKWRK